MRIHKVDDKRALSLLAAERVVQVLQEKPDAVLGLSTGETPLGMYQELIRLHKEEGLDFSHVRTFNLDEYVGLPPDHPQSYHYYMHHHFFRHINIAPENIHIPNGNVQDFESESAAYEEAIKQVGGIDLQILGIGTNGHIGFNEPGSDPTSSTRVVSLTERTRRDNSRFFPTFDEMPTHAVTLGIQTILRYSKSILLLANGEKKAEAIYRMVNGEITPEMPASYLRTHPDVTVIVDQEAGKKIKITTS